MVREIGETKNNARNVAIVYHDETFKIFKMTNRCSLEEVLKDFFKRVVKSGSILRLFYDTEYNMFGVTSQHLKPGSSKMLVIESGGLDDGFPEIRYFEETNDGYVPRDEFLAEVLKYIMTGEEGWDYIFKDGETVTEKFVIDKVSNEVKLREPLKFIKYAGGGDEYDEVKKVIDALNKVSGVDFEYVFGKIHREAYIFYKKDAHILRKWYMFDVEYVVYSDKEIVSVLSEEDFNKLFKRVL